MTFATLSLLLSAVAVLISVVGLFGERRSRIKSDRLLHHEAIERASARVILETHEISVLDDVHLLKAAIVNAGPAAARDVDVEVLRDIDGSALRFRVAQAAVGRALLAGERRTVDVHIPSDIASSEDLEVQVTWVDGTGAHEESNVLLFAGDAPAGVPVSDWALGREPWSSVPD